MRPSLGLARRTMATASSRAMATASSRVAPTFLGLDASTQGVKATLVDARLKVTHTAAVNYMADLPQYGLTDAVHRKPGHIVTQPTLMVRAAAIAASPVSSPAAAAASAPSRRSALIKARPAFSLTPRCLSPPRPRARSSWTRWTWC